MGLLGQVVIVNPTDKEISQELDLILNKIIRIFLSTSINIPRNLDTML